MKHLPITAKDKLRYQIVTAYLCLPFCWLDGLMTNKEWYYHVRGALIEYHHARACNPYETRITSSTFYPTILHYNCHISWTYFQIPRLEFLTFHKSKKFSSLGYCKGLIMSHMACGLSRLEKLTAVSQINNEV